MYEIMWQLCIFLYSFNNLMFSVVALHNLIFDLIVISGFLFIRILTFKF